MQMIPSYTLAVASSPALNLLLNATQSQSQISYTVGWPTLQSRCNYLKCMLVFKSLHGLAPAYQLMILATRAIFIHITRAIEICYVFP